GGSAGGSLGRAPSVSTSAACRHKDKSTGATSRLTSRREPVAVPDEAEQRGTIRLPAPRRDAYHPSHVRACCNNSLPGGSWTIHVWRRSDPSRSVRIPYSCNSYRCPSVECRTFAAHLDFARIREAMTRPGLEARGWVFLVLTLDRLGTYSGRRPWRDEQEAFRDLQRLSQALLRGLRREQRARGWRVTENEWVGTVESHRSGWPHLTRAVYAPELADELRRDDATLADLGAPQRDRLLVRGWLRALVTSPVSMGRERMVMTPEGPREEVVVASWG